MITVTELIENGEREKDTIEYEYDLEKVCKEYTEDDLLFYESGNRMGGLGGIIILYKNENYRVLYIDEENELLFKTFPEALNMEEKLFLEGIDKYKSKKYEWYFTGFGGKLYIDRRILKQYRNEMKLLFDRLEMPIENDYPDEQVLHAFWITIAKRILNKNRINIDLNKCKTFDSKFFNTYKIDDVLMFSFAEPGAMGTPGGVEVVIKTKGDEIVRYYGTYVYEEDESIRKKIYSFIKPALTSNNWDSLNMGMGNTLFIKKEYSKEFVEKYFKIIEKLPFILYSSWKKYADYILNIYFNNDNDISKLIVVNNDIEKNIEDFNIELESKELIKKKRKKQKEYTYVSVVYDDDFVANIIDEPSFYYKTDIDDINIGDKVLVDRLGKEVVARVIDIEIYEENDAPYPVEKTKNIIEIVEHKQNPYCPNCGKKLCKIEYGLAGEEPKNDDVVLGGCVVFDDSPVYHCKKCNKDFLDNLEEYIEE